MDALAPLIPLMPLIGAVIIGVAHFFSLIEGEAGEGVTSWLANWTLSMACLLAIALLGSDLLQRNAGEFSLGTWLECDKLKVDFAFITTGFNVQLTALFSLLILFVGRFSINYLHREKGYHRFFIILCLFASAMSLLVLSGNALVTFMGWEMAGLCSFLLIGYVYDRPVAVANAVRVFVINRAGDAAFLLGIGICTVWLQSLSWHDIQHSAIDLTKSESIVVALCFTFAALAKSAQLPFSPWLARAMEGPTPSSAVFYGSVMIHAGVFLVIQLQPLIDSALLAQCFLVAAGLGTALYAYLSGLTQSDVKSSHVFAVKLQLGAMMVECGLGFWSLAQYHLCAHAIVRCYLLLSAPSLIDNIKDLPVRTVSPFISRKHWLHVASLQRFWVEQIMDWALVKPTKHLAHDLSYFDDNIVDRVMGVPAPALGTISSIAEIEEKSLGAQLDSSTDSFAYGTGLVSLLVKRVSSTVHWFENRLVLRGIGQDTLDAGRQLGHLANKFERQVLRPRYLVLLVFITLLVAF